MVGKKVEIVSVSRSQQFDNNRPVNIGARGIVKSESSGDTWYIDLIDPKDGKSCLIWFHTFDFKVID